MNVELIIFVVVLIIAIAFSTSQKKLTAGGSVAAAVLAIIIYSGSGLAGTALLAAFFAIGVFATWWNRRSRTMYTLHENEKRDALQVLANGGVAGILSLLILAFPDFEMVLVVMVAAAFSSAAADTVSSELGIVYGTRSYNITTFQSDEKGENGVISVEGLLLGLAASVLVAAVYCVLIDANLTSFLVVVAAGTAGNLADSLLGATLERKNIIGNNAVNFLNTFIAAAIGGALIY